MGKSKSVWYRRQGKLFREPQPGVVQEVSFLPRIERPPAKEGDQGLTLLRRILLALFIAVLVALYSHAVLWGIEHGAWWTNALALGTGLAPAALMILAMPLLAIRQRRAQKGPGLKRIAGKKFQVVISASNGAATSFAQLGLLHVADEQLIVKSEAFQAVLSADQFRNYRVARALASNQGARLDLPPKAPAVQIRVWPVPDTWGQRRELAGKLRDWESAPLKSGQRVIPNLEIVSAEREFIAYLKPLIWMPFGFSLILIILSPFPDDLLHVSRFGFAAVVSAFVPLYALLLWASNMSERAYDRGLKQALAEVPVNG